MKKYFFTMMTTAMLFASCSSDDTVAPNNGTENQEDLVEIKLGTSSRIGTTVTESRAAVDNWEDVESVGIFMLDKGTAEINNWNDATATGDNIPAKLVNIKATATNEVEGKVDLDLEGSPYYYPRVSGRAYNFYGYHPYIDAEPIIDETSVTINGTSFTGKEDIMYGYAIEEDATAYSALYFREIAQNADGNAEDAMAAARPNIEFNHLTSRLKVYLIQGYDYDAENALCQVKDIQVKLPNSYTLTFTKDEPEATLTFGAEGETAENWVANSVLINELDESGHLTADEAKDDYEIEDLIQIGDVLVPSTEVGEGYEFSIYWNQDNEISPITIALTNNTEDTSDDKAFEKGKAYNIIIKVNGPKEIEITATIAEWEDGGDFEFEI